MTAAAGAATLGRSLGAASALALVVAGGLAEGLALGWAQARVLTSIAPAVSRLRYTVATVVVAGLGWAAASAPAALSSDTGSGAPPSPSSSPAAAGLGLVMGAVLGAAQAAALRGAVPHPRRWVAANAAAWPLAMVVIFLGATAAIGGLACMVGAGTRRRHRRGCRRAAGSRVRAGSSPP